MDAAQIDVELVGKRHFVQRQGLRCIDVSPCRANQQDERNSQRQVSKQLGSLAESSS